MTLPKLLRINHDDLRSLAQRVMDQDSAANRAILRAELLSYFEAKDRVVGPTLRQALGEKRAATEDRLVKQTEQLGDVSFAVFSRDLECYFASEEASAFNCIRREHDIDELCELGEIYTEMRDELREQHGITDAKSVKFSFSSVGEIFDAGRGWISSILH